MDNIRCSLIVSCWIERNLITWSPTFSKWVGIERRKSLTCSKAGRRGFESSKGGSFLTAHSRSLGPVDPSAYLVSSAEDVAAVWA